MLPFNRARFRIDGDRFAPAFFRSESRRAASAAASAEQRRSCWALRPFFCGGNLNRTLCIRPSLFSCEGIQKLRQWAVAVRHPVRSAVYPRPHALVAFGRRLGAGNDFRPAVVLVIEAVVPGLLDKCRRGQEFSVGPIDQIEEPVAIRPGEYLPGLPEKFGIDQHRVLRRVPVMDVVWRELVIPLELSGVGIEREDRSRIQVVAGSVDRRNNPATDFPFPRTACWSPDHTRRCSRSPLLLFSMNRRPTCQSSARPVGESC